MNIPRLLTTIAVATGCVCGPMLSVAADNSFRIVQVYSNLDGSVQYIQLQETAGLNGENHLAGLALRSTHDDVTKVYVFPADLPSEATANETLLIATKGGIPFYGFQDVSALPPDFIIPDRFLATNGGSIDFIGVDQVSYASLPIDGVSALDRDGNVHPALARSFQKSQVVVGYNATDPHNVRPIYKPTPVTAAATSVNAVEYYNKAFDHYFSTALAAELDWIESGHVTGWVPTGQTFAVWAVKSKDAPDFNMPICRFYIPTPQADAQFFTASPADCADVKAAFQQFILETETAFFVAPVLQTDGSIACLQYSRSGITFPVYRLFNGRADANFRYTTDRAIRDQMIANGWVPLGYGPEWIVFCASS